MTPTRHQHAENNADTYIITLLSTVPQPYRPGLQEPEYQREVGLTLSLEENKDKAKESSGAPTHIVNIGSSFIHGIFEDLAAIHIRASDSCASFWYLALLVSRLLDLTP
jgi:hypothetical protein